MEAGQGFIYEMTLKIYKLSRDSLSRDKQESYTEKLLQLGGVKMRRIHGSGRCVVRFPFDDVSQNPNV